MDVVAAGRTQFAGELLCEGEDDGFFLHARAAMRAGIDAAVTGIDDDDAAALEALGGRADRHGGNCGGRRRRLGAGGQARLGVEARKIGRSEVEHDAAAEARLRIEHEVARNFDGLCCIEDDAIRVRLEAAIAIAGDEALVLVRRLLDEAEGHVLHVDDDAVGVRKREDAVLGRDVTR